MKIILTMALTCLLSQMAMANDGTIPYIDVTEIDTHGHSVDSSVEFYGGQTKTFFDVLPPDYFDQEESRGLSFVGTDYIGSISCSMTYVRPTTGEKRDDHNCRFTIREKNRYNDPNSPDVESDTWHVAQEGGFEWKPMEEGRDINVLGIYPKGLSGIGEVPEAIYSFYGKDAYFVAQKLIEQEQGEILVRSKGYSLVLTCDYYLVEEKDDYVCSLLLGKNSL
jgi:hypothetical protein